MLINKGKIEKLYATYIYYCIVDNPEKLNQSIDKEIKNLKFSLKREWSNTHYLTTNFGVEDEPDIIKKHNLNEVDNEISKHVKIYSQNVGSYLAFAPTTRTSWFSMFKKGNYAHTHRHGFSDISGVYYYRTNGSDGDIFFESPVTETGCSKFWMNHSQTFSIEPEKGLIILFPSWLSHGVRTNTTDNMRISLSFNINFIDPSLLPKVK